MSILRGSEKVLDFGLRFHYDVPKRIKNGTTWNWRSGYFCDCLVSNVYWNNVLFVSKRDSFLENPAVYHSINPLLNVPQLVQAKLKFPSFSGPVFNIKPINFGLVTILFTRFP